MDLHPAVMIGFAIVLGLLVLAIILWFFAVIGAWADEAFENEQWLPRRIASLLPSPAGSSPG